MIENEIQFHLAAVQGSLPLLQSFLQGPNKVSVDCIDEVIFILKENSKSSNNSFCK